MTESQRCETEASADIPESLLPAGYDRLVPVEQLVHGEHNPRRVRPTAELRASIGERGLRRPLIVRPDEEVDDRYHITDGWQRYQAATAQGWEELPVCIYESSLAALAATETESIVREWSTYDWARYCQSVAAELDGGSRQALAEQVADRTVKSARTVRRYLDVLSLPDEIHVLLNDGPEGREQDWETLANHNGEVRRYDGLAWVVAGHLARRQAGLARHRVVGIAAMAVTFTHSEDAIEFVEVAAERPDQPLDSVRREVLFSQQHPRYIEVPRVVVRMERDKKEALMEYCCEERKSLTEIVAERVEELAAEVGGNRIDSA